MLDPTIAVLSDQKQFRQSVTQFLHTQGLHQVSEYRSASELLATIELSAPGLVLIDMDHGADDLFPLLREFRQRSPHTGVVVIGASASHLAANGDMDVVPLTGDAHTQMLRAVTSLAFLSQQEAMLQLSPEAQRQQHLWTTLTPRQRDVLGFLSTGSDNLKIAANLGISERAVKAHVSALLSIFTAENRTELAVLACRAGLRPTLRPHLQSQSLPQAESCSA